MSEKGSLGELELGRASCWAVGRVVSLQKVVITLVSTRCAVKYLITALLPFGLRISAQLSLSAKALARALSSKTAHGRT